MMTKKLFFILVLLLGYQEVIRAPRACSSSNASSSYQEEVTQGEQTCCICLQEQQKFQEYPCKHAFCLDCVSKLMLMNDFICPCCRRPILQKNPTACSADNGRCRSTRNEILRTFKYKEEILEKLEELDPNQYQNQLWLESFIRSLERIKETEQLVQQNAAETRAFEEKMTQGLVASEEKVMQELAASEDRFMQKFSQLKYERLAWELRQLVEDEKANFFPTDPTDWPCRKTIEREEAEAWQNLLNQEDEASWQKILKEKWSTTLRFPRLPLAKAHKRCTWENTKSRGKIAAQAVAVGVGSIFCWVKAKARSKNNADATPGLPEEYSDEAYEGGEPALLSPTFIDQNLREGLGA